MCWSVLFDIDGTLLNTGGAGRAGMQRALHRLFGATEPLEVPMSGRTDFAIAQDVLAELGLPFSRHYHALRQMYCHELTAELRARRGGLLPGVSRLLHELSLDERFQLGLLTGNGARAAQIKLSYYEIDTYFTFGGFGDWHTDRADVARLAWMEAQQRRSGRAAPPPLVIGDTPADVACGRAIGAKVLAVATGGSSLDELAASCPDWLVESLEQVSLEKLIDWLNAGRF